MTAVNRALSYALGAMGPSRVDKNGNSYALHLIQVVDNLRENLVLSGSDPNDEEVLAAAVLHDTVEDTPVTIEDLERHGFSERTVRLVAALTHKPSESYIRYLIGIKASCWEAVAIKAADATSNADLSRCRGMPTHKDLDRCLKYSLVLEFLRSETPLVGTGALAALEAHISQKTGRSAASDMASALASIVAHEKASPLLVLPMVEIEANACRDRAVAHVRAMNSERVGPRFAQKKAPGGEPGASTAGVG